MQQFFSYFKFVYHFPAALFSLFILSFLYSVLLFLLPWIYQIIYDRLLATSDRDLLFLIVFSLISLAVLTSFSNTLIEILTSYIRSKLIKLIRVDAANRLFSFKYSFFQNNDTGVTVQYLIPEIDNIATVIAQLIKGCALIMQIGILLTVMLILNRIFFIVSVAMLLIYVIWYMLFKNILLRYAASTQKYNGYLFSFFFELFSSVKLIKLFNLWDLKKTELELNLKKIRKLALVNSFLNSLLQMGSKIVFLVSIIITTICFYMIKDNQMSIGYYLIYTSIITMFMQPLSFVVEMSGKIQSGKISAIRLSEALNQNNETSGKFIFSKVQTGIEFNNVDFSYNDKSGSVLNSCSFKINKGADIAIVGESGSGKSTIANLLVRLFDTQKGSILIDGVPIQSYDLISLREKIAFFSQDSFIFNDSISFNIDIWDKYSKEHNISALKKVQLDKFSEDLKYQVGERGVRLSGGERQRVAIARLLNRNFSVLILDEPTASLDPKTEKAIMSCIKDLRNTNPDLTIITISHRLSDIIKADMIYVMNKGYIVEQGTPESLIQNKNHFYKLFYADQVSYV
jgi:ATP-binding cassette subfamily B protein